MNPTESKCLKIFESLLKNPKYLANPTTKVFKNLSSLNIRFRLCNGTVQTLSDIHFSVDKTEFLPNGKLYWRELPKGEYEKIVNALHSALCSA